jgi:cytochrome c nitrite reductase small subunit
MSKFPIFVAITAAVLALGYFAYVSEALSYMGHAPETCNNCHVMDSQYENWYHGTHSNFADCSECHIPHNNVISYYVYKGKSGAKDVFSFVTGSYPVAIRANQETKEIVQENCVRCHETTVSPMFSSSPMPLDRNCWECHRAVAHGERGISLIPYQDSALYPIK